MKHQHQYQMVAGGGAVCTYPGCGAVLMTSGPMVAGAPSVIVPGIKELKHEPLVRCASCMAPAEGGLCVLPAGHNRGKLDIPSNHQAAQPSLADDFQDLLLALHQFGRSLVSRLKRRS